MMMMVDDDEKVDVSGMYQGLTYRKGEVNELPDPAVHSPPVNELRGWWNIGGAIG